MRKGKFGRPAVPANRKLVRKQLKDLLDAEACRMKTDKDIDFSLQKLEMDSPRGKIGMSENSALKKPTHAQEQRVERFEAAVDKCYTQLKMKDIQLAKARSQMDTWRRQ
ncbi:hypothetical protein DPEC_G00095660 [Dallia pectoralis]|uniref:Uncharacterized protein n=1 Tax=Dallia pectoralis TaxID=75939 RepID=A0ACC2GVW1_DALPE|nr:hypothetical protein DPEC_G00095660 [Dallia pectoralis]